jgi:hypothetical protein
VPKKIFNFFYLFAFFLLISAGVRDTMQSAFTKVVNSAMCLRSTHFRRLARKEVRRSDKVLLFLSGYSCRPGTISPKVFVFGQEKVFIQKTKIEQSVWLCEEEKKGRLNYEKDYFCLGGASARLSGMGRSGHHLCQ